MLDLAGERPSYLEPMDMPFRNIMLWIYPFASSQQAFWTETIDKVEGRCGLCGDLRIHGNAIERLFRKRQVDLSRKLGGGLARNAGKYDYDLDPEPKAIAKAIDWHVRANRKDPDSLSNSRCIATRVVAFLVDNPAKNSRIAEILFLK